MNKSFTKIKLYHNIMTNTIITKHINVSLGAFGLGFWRLQT